ncbi:LuxR C-terminal-related transcriptional regulator [Streptomyces sp. NPDC002602]|uniref:helix-turn-helix transcriptional regulator n=1 Tax=Streptomyces sp. NPDC002602 TaxID=3364654 RepID=UPI00367669EC
MVLFGRAEETKQLIAIHAAVCSSGRSATVLLEAASGCGRSEILATLTDYTESAGSVVLQTAATTQETELPLSLLRNIVDGSSLSERLARRFRALSADFSAEQGKGTSDQLRRDTERYELQREFCAAVRELSQSAPVVLAVDDVQYGDEESLRQLLHLARHCRTAPLLVVFTQPLAGGRQDMAFGGELLRQPNFTRVRLSRLGRSGVDGVLSQTWPGRLDAPAVDRYFALSGGNPLLLRALVEDHRAQAGPLANGPAEEPRAGQVFRDALLACLERGGERSRQVAVGLAVLGDFANRELLADLLDLGGEQPAESLHALEQSGIIDGHSFRSHIARDAVLNALDPEQRVELHLRAAGLLHACGAPPYVTAEQLLQAGRTDNVWGVGVLQEAAEQVLLDDQVKQAVSYLELAHGACEDPRRRIEIRIRLALIARRISAAAAELHLSEVLDSLRVCPMPATTVRSFAELLLTHGWLDQAREVIDCAMADDPGTGEATEAGDEIGAHWAGALEPGFWPPAAPAGKGPDGEEGVHPDITPAPTWARGRSAARRSLRPWETQRLREPDQYIAGAEGLLEITPLTDFTLDPLFNAIQSLLYNGAADRVVYWCDTLLRNAAGRDTPGWEASFAALRAEANLHKGDLVAAEKGLRACLAALPERHRSAFEGTAVAHLVAVNIAQGKLDEAAHHLSRPMARSLPGTAHWLAYRRARGLYHMANHRYHSALRDFQATGRLAGLWGVDRPGLLPWRTDAAEAMLRMGERKESLRLAKEQLAMVADGSPRVRGISLHATALATEERAHVAPLLDEALGELRKAGDGLGAARVLFDLADVHEESGESRRAAAARRRATRLTKECGARSLLHRAEPADRADRTVRPAACRVQAPKPLAPPEEPPPAAGPNEADPARRQELSDSERKVAALAANGYTNREISLRLFITKSTVEQHLTRVYRKLRVAGRDELPMELETPVEV